jgi:hypothetical protein
MQRMTSSKNLSLALAATLFMSAGAAWAQSENSQAPDSPQAWRLEGTTVRLDRMLDTRTAKQGDQVEAKLDDSVKTTDGMKLPKGTELMGTVTAVQPFQNGSASSISVRFDQAKLKDGKTVPVKVTIIGAYPTDEEQLAVYGQQTMGSAPRHVPSQDRFDQEPGVLNKIAMTSRVSGHNSATFSESKGDVKLDAGTFLQVGIAQNNRSTTSGM